MWAHGSMCSHLQPLREKHTCDPRMKIDFGDLDMDHGSLQWLIGSLGRSSDLHMGPNQPIFCRWLLEALFIMMACVDGLVGPIRGRPTSRWSLQPPNSHVLCNYKQIMTCTCGTTLFAPKSLCLFLLAPGNSVLLTVLVV